MWHPSESFETSRQEFLFLVERLIASFEASSNLAHCLSRREFVEMSDVSCDIRSIEDSNDDKHVG